MKFNNVPIDEHDKPIFDAVTWYHRIQLENYLTPGIASNRLLGPGMPFAEVDFRGKSVVDIGAWDGLYSFAAESLGAASVLATDSYVWDHPLYGSTGFDLVHKAIGSTVEKKPIDITDIHGLLPTKYDIVLFFGVVYHLRDPLRALTELRKITKDTILVESACMYPPLSQEYHSAVFIEKGEFFNDASNWWIPDIECLCGMMRTAGFSGVEVKKIWDGGKPHGSRVAVIGYATDTP